MQNLNDQYNIIGIDGGASHSRAILFTDKGKTLASETDMGTNLSLYKETASQRIISMITQLCKTAKISFDDVDAVGLGLASASDQDGRDLVFKGLDSLNLSQRALIMNDAEASFEVSCPINEGILVTIGTGVICIGKKDGKSYRVGGNGHFNGDIGSGFWLGQKAVMKLAMNESFIAVDNDLSELLEIVLKTLDYTRFAQAIEETMNKENAVPKIALIAKPIIEAAEKGNELALGIVQEGTSGVAVYIIQLANEMGMSPDAFILAGNGSVIRNDFYRKSINDALIFDMPNITWVFSSICNAYGAGIIAAKLHDVKINIANIIKENN